MRTFFKSEKGVVSVFLTLIILVVFVFHAVLIDYARIVIAEKQTERAVKAASRSVMSSFDNSLVPYGLYGQTGEAAKIFEKVVQNNLAEENPTTFQFIDTKAESTSVAMSGKEFTLGNLDVFEEQVLQQMKYMAPVEFTKIMLEKFKLLDLQQDVQEVDTFIDVMSKVEPLYNDREKALDHLDDEIASDKLLSAIKKKLEDKDITEIIEATRSELPADERYIVSLGNIAVLDDIVSMSALAAFAITALKKKEAELESLKAAGEDTAELEQQIKDLQKAIDAYKAESQKLVEKVYNHFNGMSNGKTGAIKKALDYLNTAIEKNNKIKAIVDDAMAKNGGSMPDGVSLTDMYYDPAILEGWKTKLMTVKDHVDPLSTAAESVKSAFNVIKWEDPVSVTKFAATIIGDIIIMRERLPKAKAAAVDVHKVFHEQRVRMTPEQKDLKDKKEKEANGGVDTVKKEMEAIEAAAVEDATYQSVHNKFLAYQSMNKAISDAKEELAKLDDYEGAADSALNIFSKMMKAVQDGLYGLRDELYVNEYILKHFNSSEPYDVTKYESYLFVNKEIEYIMYGYNVPYMNYAAAYSQLFAMRFAINIVDQMMNPANKALGHPVLVFVVVVAGALLKTIEEMSDLTTKVTDIDFLPTRIANKLGAGKVPGMGLKVNYRDHLRFFLLINGSHDNKLMRTQAVIDHKTGVNLGERPVQVVGEATSTVKLWFLPGVIDMLGHGGILNGRVVDKNRFEFTKKAAYSY